MEDLKINEAVERVGEKYRSFLHEEANNTHWRHGGPPIYDAVNKLFEEGRTKVDESLRAEDCEIYYDPADLISKLLKGPVIEHNTDVDASPVKSGSCPFRKEA